MSFVWDAQPREEGRGGTARTMCLVSVSVWYDLAGELMRFTLYVLYRCEFSPSNDKAMKLRHGNWKR